MEQMVVCRSEKDGTIWVGPEAEFGGGRFEPLPDARPSAPMPETVTDEMVDAALAASKGEQDMAALDDIAAERRRQIEVEGYDAAHDDTHAADVLADCAAAYAVSDAAVAEHLWPLDDCSPETWRQAAGPRESRRTPDRGDRAARPCNRDREDRAMVAEIDDTTALAAMDLIMRDNPNTLVYSAAKQSSPRSAKSDWTRIGRKWSKLRGVSAMQHRTGIGMGR
jgi:hypothetical protein